MASAEYVPLKFLDSSLRSVHLGVVCPYPSYDMCVISCATPRSTAMLKMSEVDGSVAAVAMLDK